MYEQKLQLILEMENLKGQIMPLGEGAWHKAFLLTTSTDLLVIRIPKSEAYGKSVKYNEEELLAEYRSQQLFYQHVNKIEQNTAPEFFSFHVNPGLSYTVETYMGANIDLHNMTVSKAYEIGKQYGYIFRRINKEKHNLKGFGYLVWDKKKKEVEGKFRSSIAKFMTEENEEIIEEDYPLFKKSDYGLDNDNIEKNLKECLTTRDMTNGFVSFTNQDTSPENIVTQGNKINIIDPYPVLYYGHTFAGNFVNNYSSLFIALSDSPRYAKHQFHKHQPILNAIADGFIDQYSNDDPIVRELVRKEQYLQLFNSLINHIQMADVSNLKIGQQLRYGTKEQIINRIPLFREQLVNFKLNCSIGNG